METADFLELLDGEGQLPAGADAVVPTCPEWRVRDQVGHTGTVRRWAAAFVADAHTAHRPLGDPPEPADAELTPPAFWPRRQAHETTVHRYDAEAARGGTPSPIAPDLAVDGLDELLRGFHARSRSRLRSAEPHVLRVHAVGAGAGADAVWTVRLTAEPPVTVRGEEGPAEAELSGPADQLYLALRNRTAVPRVTGDPPLAAL